MGSLILGAEGCSEIDDSDEPGRYALQIRAMGKSNSRLNKKQNTAQKEYQETEIKS